MIFRRRRQKTVAVQTGPRAGYEYPKVWVEVVYDEEDALTYVALQHAWEFPNRRPWRECVYCGQVVVHIRTDEPDYPGQRVPWQMHGCSDCGWESWAAGGNGPVRWCGGPEYLKHGRNPHEKWQVSSYNLADGPAMQERVDYLEALALDMQTSGQVRAQAWAEEHALAQEQAAKARELLLLDK